MFFSDIFIYWRQCNPLRSTFFKEKDCKIPFFWDPILQNTLFPFSCCKIPFFQKRVFCNINCTYNNIAKYPFVESSDTKLNFQNYWKNSSPLLALPIPLSLPLSPPPSPPWLCPSSTCRLHILYYAETKAIGFEPETQELQTGIKPAGCHRHDRMFQAF